MYSLHSPNLFGFRWPGRVITINLVKSHKFGPSASHGFFQSEGKIVTSRHLVCLGGRCKCQLGTIPTDTHVGGSNHNNNHRSRGFVERLDRRVTAIYAIWQALLPFIFFATAIGMSALARRRTYRRKTKRGIVSHDAVIRKHRHL